MVRGCLFKRGALLFQLWWPAGPRSYTEVPNLKSFIAGALLLLGLLSMLPNSVQATSYAIPVNGRFGSLRIGLAIPTSPKWAHDTVLNASLAWNQGQLWFQRMYFPDGKVFTFVESNYPNVTVEFALPTKCVNFAVGWTDYTFAPSTTTIISAHTYLDSSIFNENQESNATARRYAFALALHELGRVLGLGNIIDSKDIMDPLATPKRTTQDPMISTLDLFAVHVLASAVVLSSNVVVLSTDQYQLVNAWSFIATPTLIISSLDSSARHDADVYNPPAPLNIQSPVKDQFDSINRFSFTEIVVMIAMISVTLGCTIYRTTRRRARIGYYDANVVIPNYLHPSSCNTAKIDLKAK